ncbi:signal peptidase I [Couchioplanes azureus]|uniref:signal peptidase I n=1 Tax=Couchioplanes caeruleus TaxID=56438 RepID=UPI00166F9D6E|nr:signal peptidase I [Couchioplanes caeruleus]GGQ60879.1 hypothetical protein GCM10010166_33180 [Couchioplanes caeruleus subsp. azureus]
MNDTVSTTKAPRFARRRTAAGLAGVVLIVAAAVFLALRFDVYTVRSTAMSGSLEPDERAVQEKVTTSDIQRGDVITFRGGTWEGDPPDAIYAMRVIGLPGDRVAANPEGQLLVNDKPIAEKYAEGDNRQEGRPFSVTVPAGRYFVMGDNRAVARDSRARIDTQGSGAIPSDRVEGRLIAIALPVWHFGSLTPGDAFTAVGPTAEAYNLAPLLAAVVCVLAGVLIVISVSGGSVRRRLAGRRR